MFKIPLRNKNKAIRTSIDLHHFVKECENNDLHWFLKLFGTYKLQTWFDKKIKEMRARETENK